MGRIIPPKEEQQDLTKQLSLRVPPELIARLDQVAEAENYTRTEIVIFLLNWALQEYEDEKKDRHRKK